MITLTLLIGLLLAIGAVLGLAPGRASDEPPQTVTVTTTRTVVSAYHGITADRWAKRFRHRTRQLQVVQAKSKALKKTLLSKPSVSEAINLSCAIYGHCADLWRKASCESHLFPGAQNPSGASGLFQFLPSTFASTPFGRFSIWDPYANALAAGWMHQQGRGGEWQCR